MKPSALIIQGILVIALVLVFSGCSTTLTGKAPGTAQTTQPFPGLNDRTGLTGSPVDPVLSQMPDPTQNPPQHSLEDTPRNPAPTGYHPTKAPAKPRNGGGLD